MFTRYDIHVTPRPLTAEERKKWPRKDKTERDCVLVYDLRHGMEIPAKGKNVTVISREHEYTYSRMERDKDIKVSDAVPVEPKTKSQPKPKNAPKPAPKRDEED